MSRSSLEVLQQIELRATVAQLLEEKSSFPEYVVIETHFSNRGDAIANKFRPTCGCGDSRDEAVQCVEERECTERLNTDRRWSSPSRPQRAFAMARVR